MVLRCWPSKRLLTVCSEGQCIRGCGIFLYWLPRVAVPLSIIWGTISHICYASSISNGLGRFVAVTFGSLFGTLALLAYYATCRVGPGFANEFPELVVPDPEAQLGDGDLPECMMDSAEAKQDGGVRFCNKCLCFKPDRTHHCRQCGACVLRMDHHCPWFSCCVGFKNHKLFLQFLWYVWGLCFCADLVGLPLLIEFFREEIYTSQFIGINFVLYFMLATVFDLVLLAFGGYTLYLALMNRTTLESMEPTVYRTSLPAKEWRYRHPPSRDSLGNIYDVGIQANLEQIMGHTWVEWLLPVQPRLKLNGTRFPINENLRAKAEERAQTEISMHQRKKRWIDEQQQSREPRMDFE